MARSKSVRRLAAALAIAAVAAFVRVGTTVYAVDAPACGINLKILVLSADGQEAALPAIRQTLDYLGTPYDLFIASTEAPLDPSRLTSGCTGLYQGVIAANGNITDPWYTILSSDEKTALQNYEALYGARMVVWYAYPTPTLGFNEPTSADWSGAPLSAAFTPAAAAVFTHVNRANRFTIQNAGVYHATALDAATQPLLVDADGHTLAAIRKDPDGRETLTLTFDSNPYLTHTLTLAYDLVNWATRGIFLGERHAYLSPQIDDLFLANQMWTPSTPCGTNVDATTTEFRITGADYVAALAWQRNLQTQPLTGNVRLTWAFNGEGASGIYQPDDLTPAVKKYSSEFHFVSHTWDHENLDAMTEAGATSEVQLNANMANKLKLKFNVKELVTPDVSGLQNAAALRGLVKAGVRYVVSDTSRAGYNNPSPNTGIWNQYEPKLFMIPRYPNNLFFNVDTPAVWAAEYNCLYRAYWGRDLTYQEIVDNISDSFVTYLLKGDLDPLMFHQPNLRAYDGRHSLLTDLLDRAIAKYRALATFPIKSPPMRDIGLRMIAREAYNKAHVSATLVPGQGVVIKAAAGALVPITGVNLAGAEQYAGQSISYVFVQAGTTTVPYPIAVR